MIHLATMGAVFVLYAIPLYIVARKFGSDLAWLAWIPIGDLFLMCDLADLDLWWIIAAIGLPGAGLVLFQIVAWCAIAENTNKPPWLGILMVLPFVNLFAGYYIAIADS